jgi:hypothetical protein
MKLRYLPAVLGLGLLAAAAPRAATTMMPIRDVTPGMVGIGRTVFDGVAIEEFKVHVLGLMRNVVGPKRDLILARLEGGPLARTGVIAGMSGSPVYIDGKLVGAVSYQLGQFSTEPIAGITPIAEMTDATALDGPARTARPVALGTPARPEELLALWRQDLGLARSFAASPGDVQLGGGLGALDAQMATMLRPIAVPLVTSGLSAGLLDPLAPALTAGGFLPVSGGAAQQGSAVGPAVTAGASPLNPGDPVGIGLLTGDFEMGATGTVTHVDGDRVYAFGHPLYNLGPTEFPMTQARVITVLPSLMTSSKLAALGAVVGTLQQDRATAVAGRLGKGPALIPVTITLNSARAGASRTFSFGVVKDQMFTPLLAYLSVANVLTSYERQAGVATYTVRGAAAIRNQGDITFEDIFAGDQSAAGAAAYVAGPLTTLFRNAPGRFDVDRLTLTIDAVEEPRTARIERVWVDSPRVRAGQDVTVKVLLRTWDDQDVIKAIPISIPVNAPATLQLLVTDGSRLTAQDARESRAGELQDVTQIIRSFNRARRGNRLYARLTAASAGAVVAGEPLPSLPPSVLAVVEGDRASGSVAPLRSATRGEWDVPVDLSVSGTRQITLTIEQP